MPLTCCEAFEKLPHLLSLCFLSHKLRTVTPRLEGCQGSWVRKWMRRLSFVLAHSKHAIKTITCELQTANLGLTRVGAVSSNRNQQGYHNKLRSHMMCPAANDALILSTDSLPLLSAHHIPTCLFSTSQDPQTRRTAKHKKHTHLKLCLRWAKLFWMKVWTCEDHAQTLDMDSALHLAFSISFSRALPFIKHLLHAMYYTRYTTGIILFYFHKDIFKKFF